VALDFSTYPPKGHEERVRAYERYEPLFLGQDRELFNVQPRPCQLKRYIVANFGGLISRLSGDLLFASLLPSCEGPIALAPRGTQLLAAGRARPAEPERPHILVKPLQADFGGLLDGYLMLVETQAM
jgi:hypothetical protein